MGLAEQAVVDERCQHQIDGGARSGDVLVSSAREVEKVDHCLFGGEDNDLSRINMSPVSLNAAYTSLSSTCAHW